jgi:hypothetical protein
VCRHDHLVTGSNAEAAEDERKRVAPAADRGAVLGGTVGGELGLKRFNLRTHQVKTRPKHSLDCAVDLAA